MLKQKQKCFWETIILFSNWICNLCCTFSQLTGEKSCLQYGFLKGFSGARLENSPVWDPACVTWNVWAQLIWLLPVNAKAELKTPTKHPLTPVLPIFSTPRELVHWFFICHGTALNCLFFPCLAPCSHQSSSSPSKKSLHTEEHGGSQARLHCFKEGEPLMYWCEEPFL